nr:putative Gag-polypeptide of LTR copia-type [Tanacetum cinerariifolium]
MLLDKVYCTSTCYKWRNRWWRSSPAGANPLVVLINNLDAGNPLYVHNSDNSSYVLVPLKLLGTANYRMWNNAMKLVLQARNKYGFVDGTCLRDSFANSKVLCAQWDRCNAMVLTWIINVVSSDVYIGLVYFENAASVWEDLNETHDKVDGSMVYNLLQKIRSVKQGGNKGIVISELKKLIEKLKGKSVDTKFEKSSVIRQPNAFKSQRPSVLGKPTTFLNSFVRKDFSKSTSVTQNNVLNDFSKPVTAQTLPTNKKPCLKNMNVLAPGMYKLHTDHTQAITSKLPQNSKKTNKRVSFSTGVIPTTSVSKPQLKSNPQGNKVMHNNSRGKKLEVEEHRRNVKLPTNKMSATACNDSLNAKTLNVKSISAMCDKCVLIDKHDMYVLKSVAKPRKETVASESNKKPRNNVRKLYERLRKIYMWSYIKFTPSGYMWKPKSPTGNVNPNVS